VTASYPYGMQAWLDGMVRKHPDGVDSLLAAVLFALSLASAFYVAHLAGWPWAIVLNGVPPVLSARRRREPRLVLAACLGLGLAQWWLRVPFNLSQVVTLVALYTVARYEPRPVARVALAACLTVVLIAPIRQPYVEVGGTVLAGLTVIVVYVLGTNVGLRQSYLRALEERAQRLERERDAAAQAATSLERTRIARELHDVVAHHVSVMVVQAEGAGWAIDDAPDQARTAVATIARTGRAALVELRRLLGVLREGDRDGVLPQPGMRDLPALVSGFRGDGLNVHLELDSRLDAQSDEPSVISESMQLAAFRIVQEGLTNVLKHAGTGTAVRVGLRVDPRPEGSVIILEIQDDGSGRPAGGSARSSGSADPGHGVIGIRERVELFDGEVEVGPGPDGGFAVRAVLPLPVDAAGPEGRP
jgi:signal transduction histidine kinase